MTVRIKRLAPADTAELLAAAELFDSPPVEEAARAYLADENSVVLLAYDGSDVAGFIRGMSLPQIETTQRQMFLYEIDVAPAFRRRASPGRWSTIWPPLHGEPAATRCSSSRTVPTTPGCGSTRRPAE